MIGRGLPGYNEALVRKQVPLSDLRGMSLPDDSWIVGDQQEYSKRLLEQEGMQEAERYRGLEMADQESQQSREADILSALQDLIAEQSIYSQQAMRGEVQHQLPSLKDILAMPMQAKTVDLPFGQAFAAARAKGLKKFTWRGKEYTTEIAKPYYPMKHAGRR